MIRDGAFNFNAAIHRAWVHHNRIRLGEGQLFRIQPIEAEEFARRGHHAARHAFALQPQHHHNIGARQPGLHVVEYFHAQARGFGGDQRGRPHHAHAAAHGGQQMHVGTRHARMGDIAANRDNQTLKPALVAADGERIQ